MKTGLAMATLGFLLAGCGGKSTAGGDNSGVIHGTASGPIPTSSSTGAADPVEAKINALNDSQRKTAFFRAIYDADYQCDKIEKVESKPRSDDRPVWVATCDDQGEYVITLQPGGIFTVSGVPQAKRRMPKSTVILPAGTK